MNLILALPGLWASDPSPLRQNLPALAQLSERGSISKLVPNEEVATPEALLLGIPPDQGQLAPGPLMVSALGFDPPERSTHFCCSLLTLEEDGRVSKERQNPSPDESAGLKAAFTKLNTKSLTLLFGSGSENALVWEDWGDHLLKTPEQIQGCSLREHLPQGDAEKALRRFIDDSANLLGEQEFNRIRAGEGRPLLNLLWPWGAGLRTPMPNLALRRGEPALVLTDSLRMAGLARLVGYRFAGAGEFKRGLNADWKAIFALAKKATATCMVYSEVFDRLAQLNRLEEREWLMKEIDRDLLTPLEDQLRDKVSRFAFLAPGASGLALACPSTNPEPQATPFDERALEERRLPSHQIWESASRAFLPA